MTNAMNPVERAGLDPFARARQVDAGAGPQPGTATLLELHREWAAVQQEWVDLELAARKAVAGTNLDDAACVFVDGFRIAAEKDITRLPPERRRVAQRALHAAQRKREQRREAAGLDAIAARTEAVARRADVLRHELDRAPVRNLAEIAALLDAAIDSGMDLPGAKDPIFRDDALLVWKLIDALTEMTGHDFGSIRRQAALGPPLECTSV